VHAGTYKSRSIFCCRRLEAQKHRKSLLILDGKTFQCRVVKVPVLETYFPGFSSQVLVSPLLGMWLFTADSRDRLDQGATLDHLNMKSVTPAMKNAPPTKSKLTVNTITGEPKTQLNPRNHKTWSWSPVHPDKSKRLPRVTNAIPRGYCLKRHSLSGFGSFQCAHLFRLDIT
jgi:hypothetical protein